MTKSFQKISVVTGTRAEYGLLFWILREIESEPSLDLQLVVSGTHLSAEFGNTVETIRKDGFLISAEVPCISDDDSFVGMGRDFAKASLGFVDAFAKLKPDLVILLGDRFECLAAACSASILRIPIAHIHGGEVTEGALDEYELLGF